MKRIILFTIETINREFDYKFYLATQLAEHGFECHLVSCDYYKLILFNKSEKYILLDKVLLDYLPNEVKRHRLLKLNTNQVLLIYLNEEASVFKGYENSDRMEYELKSMYDASVFNKDNIVCSPGEFQHKIAVKHKHNCELVKIGIPRFSLYSSSFIPIYSNVCKQINHKYKDFILINTNYSLFNSIIGEDDVFTINHPENNISHCGQIDEITLSYVNEGKQVLAFIELILLLARKYPKLNFILRPHPSENPYYYNKFFKGISNIFIEDTGPVNEYILACRALIHNGCTTAIEAYLAQKPVFAYDVIGNHKYICGYPNIFGSYFTSKEELLLSFDKVVEDNFNFHSGFFTKHPKSDILYNIEDNNLPIKKYLDVILETGNLISSNSNLRYSLVGVIKFYIVVPFLVLLNSILKRKIDSGRNKNNKRKFYGFKNKLIKNRVNLMYKNSEGKFKIKYRSNYQMIIQK